MNKQNTSLIAGLIALGTLTLSPGVFAGEPGVDYSRDNETYRGAGPDRGPHGNHPTPEKVTERLFELYDVDGDGELYGEEISEAAYAMAERRLNRRHPQADKPVDAETVAARIEDRMRTKTDLDGNGGISPDELVTALADRGPRGGRPNPEKVSQHLFSLYDVDGDGELFGEEISETAYAIAEHRPPRRGPKADKPRDTDTMAEKIEERLLTDMDLDENGGISPDELTHALETMRPKHPPHRRG